VIGWLHSELRHDVHLHRCKPVVLRWLDQRSRPLPERLRATGGVAAPLSLQRSGPPARRPGLGPHLARRPRHPRRPTGRRRL